MRPLCDHYATIHFTGLSIECVLTTSAITLDLIKSKYCLRKCLDLRLKLLYSVILQLKHVNFELQSEKSSKLYGRIKIPLVVCTHGYLGAWLHVFSPTSWFATTKSQLRILSYISAVDLHPQGYCSLFCLFVWLFQFSIKGGLAINYDFQLVKGTVHQLHNNTKIRGIRFHFVCKSV